jgi:predicted nucleic acid-binding protein
MRLGRRREPRWRHTSIFASLSSHCQLPERVCRDKHDDIVLATALAGKADFIVTGDDDLLALKKFRGIRILSPRNFLEFLDRR